MNEKKKLILETAMQLFAKKGFHSTSIQEIANESGISKGAVYLHFQSKDDVLYSIFSYYYEKLQQKVAEVNLDSYTPEERLQKLLQAQAQEILHHKEFIIMQFREQAIAMNKEIDELIMQIRINSLQTLASGLKDLYGERITPILPDCVLLLDGMFSSYMKLIVLQDIELNVEQLPAFIISRMHDVVEGMLRNHTKPFLPLDQAYSIYQATQPGSCEQTSPIILLSEMETTINQLTIKDGRKKELIETVRFLMKELENERPRPFIFKGMLHQFEGVSELDSYTADLVDALDLE